MVDSLPRRAVSGNDYFVSCIIECICLCSDVPLAYNEGLVASGLHPLECDYLLVGESIRSVCGIQCIVDVVEVAATLLI